MTMPDHTPGAAAREIVERYKDLPMSMSEHEQLNSLRADIAKALSATPDKEREDLGDRSMRDALFEARTYVALCHSRNPNAGSALSLTRIDAALQPPKRGSDLADFLQSDAARQLLESMKADIDHDIHARLSQENPTYGGQHYNDMSEADQRITRQIDIDALSALSKGANAPGKQEPIGYISQEKLDELFDPENEGRAGALITRHAISKVRDVALYAGPSSIQDERDAVIEECALKAEKQYLHHAEAFGTPRARNYEHAGKRIAEAIRALKHAPKAGQEGNQ